MADNTQEKADAGCIRVLHFVSTLSRGSGVMSVIMNYYRHIDRDKVQFDFLHFVPDKESAADSHAEEIRTLGGRIYLVEKPGSSVQSVKQLESFFRVHAKEYAWLHNHEVYLTFLLRPISKRYGLEKFIVHCHATKYSDKPLNAVRNRLLCLPIPLMKVERFACSEAAGKFLYGKRKMKSGKVFIMHNAIDCEKFRFRPEVRERLRKEMGLEGKFVIGHVGRFERQKNHEFLIRVFAEYKKVNPLAVLLLIGEGSLKERIERQVINFSLDDSVFFLNQISNVHELLQVMDLFLLPSIYEGFPVSCIEAQASGIPCIISTAITNEVCINASVVFCDLMSSPSAWCDAIYKLEKKFNRSKESSLNLIEKKGYSLKKEAYRIENKYLGGIDE